MAGPVAAKVLSVIDGDTLDVEARIWLGQAVRVRVRVIGIDTPEKRSKCAQERQAADAARSYLSQQVANGTVELRQIRYGKFAGRVLARIFDSAGGDIAQRLLGAGHARTYHGGKRQPWCDAAGRFKP